MTAKEQLVGWVRGTGSGFDVVQKCKALDAIERFTNDRCATFMALRENLRQQQLNQAIAQVARSSGHGSKAAVQQQAPRKTGPSPKTSTLTVKLSDPHVKLLDRFEGIQQMEATVADLVPVDKIHTHGEVEYVLEKMVTVLLRCAPLVDFKSEAGLVHLMSKVLDEIVFALRPCSGARVVATGQEPDEEVVTEQQQEGGPWVMGYEQCIRAGTRRGRIGIQYVQKVLENGKRIYIGAVEVTGSHTGPGMSDATQQQCMKELFALWCHNARRNHYEEVWMLLTNGEKIMKLTYKGLNAAGKDKPYYNRMRCSEVRGELRISPQYGMWMWDEKHTSVSSVMTTPDALALLLHTFCTEVSPGLDTLKQQEQEREQSIEEAVSVFKGDYKRHFNRKRSRQDDEEIEPASRVLVVPNKEL